LIFKTITVEFYEPWGKGFRTFNGWVYYLATGSSYVFYEISPSEHKHKPIATIEKARVKAIREKFL
jgi:hypothetical protein